MQRLKNKCLLFLLLIISLVSCTSKGGKGEKELVSIKWIDRQGFKETISSKERLDSLKHTNFSDPQPYEKVTRVFQKNREGKIPSCITTYHPNGQLWQYLEVVNGRASGYYRERFSNGTLRLEVVVIEGIGDITDEAQKTYLFDGLSRAWDESGKLLAEINYEKGKLQGNALYYYPSGRVQKLILFEKHLIEGEVISYNEEGGVNGKTPYKHGKKEGRSFFKGDASHPSYAEEYRADLLIRGSYHDLAGNLIAAVEEGEGKKASFVNGRLYALSEIHQGVEEGEVLFFDEHQAVKSSFHLLHGLKHGDEKIYYPRKKGEKTPQLKCIIPWYEDMIQGIYRTWYEDGTLESEREMHQNEKQGLFCCWYKDNSLMLVEEYQHDVLTKGSYYKKGDPIPVSSIVKGEGKATLYDSGGSFLKEVSYYEGHPVSGP